MGPKWSPSVPSRADRARSRRLATRNSPQGRAQGGRSGGRCRRAFRRTTGDGRGAASVSPTRGLQLNSARPIGTCGSRGGPSASKEIYVKKRLVTSLVLAVLACTLVPSLATAADVYESYTKVGRVTISDSGRYDVYESYHKIGYVKSGYSGRWDVYQGYSKAGYVKPGYSGRWDIYEGY